MLFKYSTDNVYSGQDYRHPGTIGKQIPFLSSVQFHVQYRNCLERNLVENYIVSGEQNLT